jgi:hypothetical protein
MKRRRRASESGFALLLVFLMAAIAAIGLYYEYPRIVQESQRQKEQLLVERGEQYKRAIQLFLRASNNQRWPASIDELESFNGRRFLRHRYKDPMTGKEEWRLIHIQNGVLTDSVEEWRLIHIQNGVLTDSVTMKPQGKKTDDKDLLANQTVGDYGGNVGTYGAPGSTGLVNLAQRRRPSDNATPGGMPGASPAGGLLLADGSQPQPIPQPGIPNPMNPTGNTGLPQPGQPVQPGQPGQPGLPGQPPNLPPGIILPGQPNQLKQANNNNQGSYSSVGNYGSTVGTGPVTGSQPNAPSFPGQLPPGVPGPPANSQNFGGTPAYPNMPGAQGVSPQYPQPGMNINPNQTSAAQNMINNLLTTPRPGGLQGIQRQGQTMGGGIAGVASKAEGESIMIYHDHQDYSEWEFIFDPTKQKFPPPNPVTGAAIGTPASQLGTPAGPGMQPGTQPPQQQQNNPFMQQSQPDVRGGRQ